MRKFENFKQLSHEIDSIDFYVPLHFREMIEKNYYEKINQNLLLENVINDKSFLEDPIDHVALYSDHGVIHVRNVTRQVLEIIPVINGVLFPKREHKRLEFMKGYACILAYLHDIGMINPTSEGRAIHAEFIAHEIFKPHFDVIIDYIWENNVGGLSWNLYNLYQKDDFCVNPQIILREIMALAYCHSKSAVPINIINDAALLRRKMQECLTFTLKEIYYKKKLDKLEKETAINPALQEKLAAMQEEWKLLVNKNAVNNEQSNLLSRFYKNLASDSYLWLDSKTTKGLEFINDITDILRLIRTADALRQRGTVLKTSGNYQIFVDKCTGNAIYALKSKTGKLFLVSGDRPINAAEANLASASLTTEGDLYFSFYCGNFTSRAARNKAINNLVILIDDIQLDVLDSFYRSPDLKRLTLDYLKKNQAISILLETTDDYPPFTKNLAKALIKCKPALAPLIKLVPSMRHIPSEERERYLSAEKLDWTLAEKRKFLQQISQMGHITKAISLKKAFDCVKIITILSGKVLMENGTYAGFVYVPLGKGLKGLPSGGYDVFEINPFVFVGSTGVIRGDIRNATVTAGQTVEVLMIPKEIYLKYWHKTYTGENFVNLIKTKGIN